MKLLFEKLLHPITVFLIQNAFTIFTIAFTSPSSTIRLALLPLSLASIYVIYPNYLDLLPRGVVASILAGSTFANVLQYVDLVILSRWSLDRKGPSAVPEQNKLVNGKKQITKGTTDTKDDTSGDPPSPFSAIYQRFQYGYFINSASRLIGTNYQVKNVPEYLTSNPSYIPSRALFLRRKAFIFCVCYLLLDLATASAKAEENHIHYSLDRISFFHRIGEVSSEEIVRKLVGGVGYWTASYCTMQCYMGAWAMLCVVFGGDPKYWRPNFGSLSEGYTIRRFWGKFWHQHLRRPLTSIATFFIKSFLNLSEQTLLGRYTHLTFVFFLSGLLHMFTEVAAHGGGSPTSTLSFYDSGCVRFFLTQALGIIVEDGMQSLGKRLGLRTKGKMGLWLKALGWVWLVTFLGWSTPALMYPAARLNTGKGKDALLPFSIVAALKS